MRASQRTLLPLAQAALIMAMPLSGCNGGATSTGLSCEEARSRFALVGEQFQRANEAVMAASDKSRAEQRRLSEQLLRVAEDSSRLVKPKEDCFSAAQRKAAGDSLTYIKRLRDQAGP